MAIKEVEHRSCSECPKTFPVRPGSRKLTCSKKCKRRRTARLLREGKGIEMDTRQCPVCQGLFGCPSTSAMVTCGRRPCVDTWAVACRKYSNAKRRETLKSSPQPPQKPGAYSLECDPFLFSMSTGCPGVRTWLCPEMLPFDYQAGAVCVAGRS